MSRRELFFKTGRDQFLIKFFRTQKFESPILSETLKEEDLIKGVLPPVALGLTEIILWVKDYEETYLERDIRQRSQIENLIYFRHLLLRIANILSLSDLARDSKLNGLTVLIYLSLLESSFIIRRIRLCLKSIAIVLIKSPKIRMSDSGLACYLVDIDTLDRESPKVRLFGTYFPQNLHSII